MKMTIENEAELRDAYENIAKMYRLSDQIAHQPVGDPATNDAVRDGVEAMIRKIERQISDYHLKNPQLANLPIKAA